jgi:hypothetical protein
MTGLKNLFPTVGVLWVCRFVWWNKRGTNKTFPALAGEKH